MSSRKFTLLGRGMSRFVRASSGYDDCRDERMMKPNMKRKTQLLILVILLSVPLLAGCDSSNRSSVDSSRTPSAPVAYDDHAMTAIPRINPSDADFLVKQGQAIIIDVRAEPAYRAQHIKGSTSLPEAQVLPRLNTLPRDKKIITYCT